MSKSAPKRLLVGLGNPGSEYAGTRHNIGFRVIDQLAEKWRISLAHEQDALVGWNTFRGFDVALAKPQRYVNRSGSVLKQLLDRHNLTPEQVLVILDDLHLDTGVLRMRPSGSDGGHNGMQDVIQKLGTREIARLRIGIGNEYRHGEQADYVLSPFDSDQEEDIEFATHRAIEAAMTFVEEGVEEAMNRFNG